MEHCIWCAKRSAESLEHIAPDALGCPKDFVLTSGVCAECNRKNGALDRALLTPFEIITVMKGVPRKNNKAPTVNGFSSLASGYDENGPVFYINQERHDVTIPNGRILKGTNSLDPIKHLTLEQQSNGMTKISYQQELRFDRKAVRGLFKIALESVAFFYGLEAARRSEFDRVRHFVRNGGGNFRAILTPDQNSAYDSYFGPPFIKQDYETVVGMTILGIGFICDFDPTFKGGFELLAESQKQAVNSQVIPNWPRRLWSENNSYGSLTQ